MHASIPWRCICWVSPSEDHLRLCVVCESEKPVTLTAIYFYIKGQQKPLKEAVNRKSRSWLSVKSSKSSGHHLTHGSIWFSTNTGDKLRLPSHYQLLRDPDWRFNSNILTHNSQDAFRLSVNPTSQQLNEGRGPNKSCFSKPRSIWATALTLASPQHLWLHCPKGRENRSNATTVDVVWWDLMC